MSTSNFLITCIVERGRAEEVMRVAREAGAKGGTVLPARGTSTADDKRFLGIPVMPAEKEVLLIVADNEEAPIIMGAICKMPIFKEIGRNIVYSAPLHEFYIPER
jgi:nitrogen regulatory protein PII